MAARARLPRQRRRRAARQRGRGGRALPRMAGAARRAGLRDRRGRGQGRRRRAAAPPRRGRARPALGDRLEVPAHDRRHDAARGALERRQVRRPASVRAPGAGPRRRRDGEDGDAAQRGGPRPQGRAAGRRGDRPARRRRDPAGALPGPARRREPRPRAGAAPARQVPLVRHPHGQAGGRGVHALPEPGLPGPPLAAAQVLRGDHGRRRPRREAGGGAAGARARSHRGRLLPPARRAAHGARGLRPGQRGEARAGDRRLKGAAVRRRAVRRRDRGRRLRHGPQPGRHSSARWTLCSPPAPRTSPRRPAWGRSWPS